MKLHALILISLLFTLPAAAASPPKTSPLGQCIVRGARTHAPLKKFQGFIELPESGRVYVDVLPGKPKSEPLIMLGGLSFDLARSDEVARMANVQGVTLIRPELLGQGKTLAAQLSDGRHSPGTPIPYQDQLKLIHELQEYYGLEHTAVGGISYGGGIAGAYAADYPGQVSRALLVAPFIRSAHKNVPAMAAFWDLAKWNPYGKMIFDQSSRASLRIMISAVPESLKENQNAFYDTLYDLSEGIDSLDLAKHAQQIRVPTYVLKVRNDQAVPESTVEDFYSRIPEEFQAGLTPIDAQHDTFGSAPQATATWTAKSMK